MEMLVSGNMKIARLKALNDAYQAFQLFLMEFYVFYFIKFIKGEEKVFGNMHSLLFPIITRKT